MGLQTQLPLRVIETKADRQFGVAPAVRTIHRLDRKAAEGEIGKSERVEPFLGYDDFQLVAGGDDDWVIDLWANANPVEIGWQREGSVGLDRDLEAAPVQRLDQRWVELQQRLAPSADDEFIAVPLRPQRRDLI